jgi:RNAse (barnase) inhibitor barstar
MSAMSQKLQTLLAQTERSGIYHLPHSDCKALKQAALTLHFGWLQTDFGESRDIAAILEKIGHDLRLPEWYGANHDALADCLSDLSWNAAPGYVLLIAGAGKLHDRDRAAFDLLNEVLGSVIGDWQAERTPFWVFYDLPAKAAGSLPPIPAS